MSITFLHSSPTPQFPVTEQHSFGLHRLSGSPQIILHGPAIHPSPQSVRAEKYVASGVRFCDERAIGNPIHATMIFKMPDTTGQSTLFCSQKLSAPHWPRNNEQHSLGSAHGRSMSHSVCIGKSSVSGNGKSSVLTLEQRARREVTKIERNHFMTYSSISIYLGG